MLTTPPGALCLRPRRFGDRTFGEFVSDLRTVPNPFIGTKTIRTGRHTASGARARSGRQA